MKLLPSLSTGTSQLSPRDAEFIYNESDGHLGHLIAVYLFDTSQHPDAEFTQEQAIEWTTTRLGYSRMFTQRIRRIPLGLEHPYWDPFPDFDIRNHIRVTKITEPGWNPLQKSLNALTTSRMDLDRPPWELHFFTGIENLDDLPPRLTAVVLKSHHSAGDGLAIRALGENMFSDRLRPTEFTPSTPFIQTRMFAKSVPGVVGQTTRFAKKIADTRSSANAISQAEKSGAWVGQLRERPANRFNGKVSGSATLGPITISGNDVRGIKDAVPGATVNDVLLTIVGGALMQYLTSLGERPAGSLVAMVPRSMRQVEKWESANQLVTLCVDMHTETDDPIQRLALIAKSAQSEKTRTSYPAVRHFGTRFDSIPAPLLRLLSYTRNLYHYDTKRPRYHHTTVSNIPLSIEGLTLNGAPGAAVLAIQPPVDSDGLRHFMVASIGGGLTLNVIADAQTMPDIHPYLLLVRESFENLKQASEERSRRIDRNKITSESNILRSLNKRRSPDNYHNN